MNALSAAQAREFAQRWLPAWTGNDPERLAGFHADAFYVDPGIPQGVRGQYGARRRDRAPARGALKPGS